MIVHVICCNDSVEYAVVGVFEKAEEKMWELSAADFEKRSRDWSFKSREDYLNRMYWHIHSVDGEQA